MVCTCNIRIIILYLTATVTVRNKINMQKGKKQLFFEGIVNNLKVTVILQQVHVISKISYRARAVVMEVISITTALNITGSVPLVCFKV